MPDTRLILHVKGTQAETAELPKEVVRAAISQGQLTHSQLIWSPMDNAWKQVRELPDLLPSERLILHVKGTEAETTELPKHAVRAAISQGQLTHSQLIWSSADNAWKQVRELPDLLPSQKLAPSPSREAAVPVPRAVDAVIPESPTGPVARAASAGPPRVRVASASAGPPRVRVASASAGTPTVRASAQASVPSTRGFEVKEDEGSHPLKWICIGLGILILLVLGGNYLLVDQPLVSNLGQTSYSNVRVYAHLGAFMQPNVMVIHIPASSTITPDNLTDFLAALARSTPQNPINRDLFARVALTSGWTVQYSFSGYSWKQLGDMRQEDKAQQKEALLDRLGDAGGQPLMPESTLNEAAQQATRDKVWNTFVAHFTAKP
jgi:hypothetical protein